MESYSTLHILVCSESESSTSPVTSMVVSLDDGAHHLLVDIDDFLLSAE